jgi:hypothetical protein
MRPAAAKKDVGPRIFSERERILWEALDSFIQRHEGWIISLKDVSPLRFECRADCRLPELLTSMGYSVTNAGMNERLMPFTEMVIVAGSSRTIERQHVGPIMVSVYSFPMPGF